MTTRVIVCGAAGRMGRAILRVAAEEPRAQIAGAIEMPGHPTLGRDAGAVAGIAELGVPLTDDYGALAGPDTVTLDFTNAASALGHLRTAVEQQAGIVIGSTGFSADQRAELDQLAGRTRTVIAANMSIGVAVLQRLIRQAASVLAGEFDMEIVEMHHRMKVDAPSGTALALAETLAQASQRELRSSAVYGREGLVGKRTAEEIGVLALRGGDVVGDHTVIFAGLGERLELSHRAHSRDCLARGAVRAALWLDQQPRGRYGIDDVLGWK
ncbi:MAG TPA: 4-hydroxy-tetrahydrodipicolinate reductase [Terriglobales bacterium]|nr:4-hydroxy-tetrahydrodipicolinate reductase [Terriglobales bacterium]